VLQLPLLALAVVMMVHGFFGPGEAPRNLATVLTWIHYRGALVIVLLAAGNLFCMACPFMLPRELARMLVRPVRHWPARLRNKWTAILLFAGILFAYELFDLWNSPWWTAALIAGYFAAALVVDSLFSGASFCKYLCPIGQFNFVASTLSPLELRIADGGVCARCATRDCINGRRDARDASIVVRRGCELALFQPEKRGNVDCTLCLDCVYACPHDNITLAPRLPASELWGDPRRSGIGFFSSRPDLAALTLVFTFGALLNVFGMVSPVHVAHQWISGILGTTHEAPVLAALFGFALVIEPVALLGLAAVATRWAGRRREPLLPIATRFAYALVPLGVAVWAAHYLVHLLTGFLSAIPAAQSALAMVGAPWLDSVALAAAGMPPTRVAPLSHGVLLLGLAGSLLVAYRIAERQYHERATGTFVPWAMLILLLWGVANWLLLQPMEMRGTMMMMGR
jgi:ferredoxin